MNKAALDYEKADRAKKRAARTAKSLSKVLLVELEEDEDEENGDEGLSSERHPFFAAWYFNGPMSDKHNPMFHASLGPGADIVSIPKGTSRQEQREREPYKHSDALRTDSIRFAVRRANCSDDLTGGHCKVRHI